MNTAATPSPRGAADEALLQAKLIRHWKLEEKDLLRITVVMDERGVDFITAMIELGIARADEIQMVLAPAAPIAKIGNQTLLPDRRLAVVHDSAGSRSEQVRALRTELLLRARYGQGANTLALLSPRSGEGRSQLAAELAIVFAQLGRRTLLIDADLRKPSLHRFFNAGNQHGLSDVLANTHTPVLHPVAEIPGLSVLLAGPRMVNALELLSAGNFGRWMDVWRRNYDFILLDTSPVEQFSDALTVAAQVDAVLAVSRADHTPSKAFSEMIRRLAATKAAVIGAVINQF